MDPRLGAEIILEARVEIHKNEFMNRDSTIQAISFDAVGTLFHLCRSVGEGYAEAARDTGWELDPETTNRAFGRIWNALPDRGDGIREDDDRSFWREMVSGVLEECGAVISAEIEAAFFEKVYARYAGKREWTLYPEVAEVLEKLAVGHQLAITSNYDRRLYRTLEELGIRHFFEVVTVSSTVGSDKPSPAIFHATCGALKLLPGQVLHVGDEPKADFEGAQAAGLVPWLLTRPAKCLGDLPLR